MRRSIHALRVILDRRELGATAVEYGLIAALIAGVIAGTVALIGPQLIPGFQVVIAGL